MHLNNILVAFSYMAIYNLSDDEGEKSPNSHWKLISSFNAISTTTETKKYHSALTGLTVILTKVDTPIANVEFVLAVNKRTEKEVDHALEHLVLLGSKEYPYEDGLRLLLGRSLADFGASVYRDFTVYQARAASSSGLINHLPVYLDHILYPLLRKEDFLTEVYHINGEGLDRGVVYNERKDAEYSIDPEYDYLFEILYPGTGIGSKRERIFNVLGNITIQKVRDLHKKFYRPENLALVITANVNEEELFRSLKGVEDKILRNRCHEKPEPFVKPWQNDLPKIPINQTKEIVLKIPSFDEEPTRGAILVGWRIPQKMTDDIKMLQAFKIALYFLQEKFGVVPDYSRVELFKEPAILMAFGPLMDDIDDVLPTIDSYLEDLEYAGLQQYDMDDIQYIIDMKERSSQMKRDNEPHSYIREAARLDHAYGYESSHLKEFATDYSQYFRKKDAKFWADLIQEVFIKNPKYSLKLISSKETEEQLYREEKEKTEQIRETLGPDGLKAKQEELDEAVNSKTPISREEFKNFPGVSVDSIKFQPYSIYNRTLPSPLVDFQDIPFKIQLVDVRSTISFYFYIFLDRTQLSDRETKLLGILEERWLSPEGFENTAQGVFRRKVEGPIKRFWDEMQELTASLNSPFYNDPEDDTFEQLSDAEVKELNDIIAKLTNPNTVFVYLGTNVKELTRLYGKNIEPLTTLFNHTNETSNLSERFKFKPNQMERGQSRFEFNPDGKETAQVLPRHRIYETEIGDFCKLLQDIPIPEEILKERAPLEVLLKFMNQVWYSDLRGRGLKYIGVAQRSTQTPNTINLDIQKSTNLTEAYRATRDTISDYIKDIDAMEMNYLDTARGLAIVEWTDKESSPAKLVEQTLEAYIKEDDSNLEIRNFVRELEATSTEKLKKLGSKIFPLLFDSNKTETTIICNYRAIPQLIQDFKQFDIDLVR